MRRWGMKKIILILIFILIAQSGYKTMLVLAEEVTLTPLNPVSEVNESAEIKKVIEAFLQCSVRGDIECLMSYVSEKFTVTADGKTSDYNAFKLRFENLFKNTIDRSFDNLKVIESNVSDDKATILVEYLAKAFNLKNSKDYEIARKVQYSLIKEGGSWKIIAVLTIS